ncbi:MAG: hypothetical protein LBM98_08345 [Oscillospiraceae bacterium]|nr:hypothetical protein [Oscillospiraceae bacterium]
MPLSVIASRGKLAIRTIETGAAIQCRERNIRICGLYYWIASRLNRVISRASRRFAMTNFFATGAMWASPPTLER